MCPGAQLARPLPRVGRSREAAEAGHQQKDGPGPGSAAREPRKPAPFLAQARATPGGVSMVEPTQPQRGHWTASMSPRPHAVVPCSCRAWTALLPPVTWRRASGWHSLGGPGCSYARRVCGSPGFSELSLGVSPLSHLQWEDAVAQGRRGLPSPVSPQPFWMWLENTEPWFMEATSCSQEEGHQELTDVPRPGETSLTLSCLAVVRHHSGCRLSGSQPQLGDIRQVSQTLWALVSSFIK